MVLAPFLIFGWGTGRPLGVAGAAHRHVRRDRRRHRLARSLLPRRRTSYLQLRAPPTGSRSSAVGAMLAIGLPAGAEFALMAVYLFIVYCISRPFGAAAQAGFGIGMRIVQALFMPVVALGFAVAPVAGQNFGARQRRRACARRSRRAALMAAGVMLARCRVVCHIAPARADPRLLDDPEVIAVGEEYLRIVSWNFVASGIVFVASSMFQAMGNTLPSLVSVVRAHRRHRDPGVPAVAAARVRAALDLVSVGRRGDAAAGDGAAAAAPRVPAAPELRGAGRDRYASLCRRTRTRLTTRTSAATLTTANLRLLVRSRQLFR